VHAGAGGPSWCSNQYIERGAHNAQTNCIGCHQHAGTGLASEDVLADSLTFPQSGRAMIHRARECLAARRRQGGLNAMVARRNNNKARTPKQQGDRIEVLGHLMSMCGSACHALARLREDPACVPEADSGFTMLLGFVASRSGEFTALCKQAEKEYLAVAARAQRREPEERTQEQVVAERLGIAFPEQGRRRRQPPAGSSQR